MRITIGNHLASNLKRAVHTRWSLCDDVKEPLSTSDRTSSPPRTLNRGGIGTNYPHVSVNYPHVSSRASAECRAPTPSRRPTRRPSRAPSASLGNWCGGVIDVRIQASLLWVVSRSTSSTNNPGRNHKYCTSGSKAYGLRYAPRVQVKEMHGLLSVNMPAHRFF